MSELLLNFFLTSILISKTCYIQQENSSHVLSSFVGRWKWDTAIMKEQIFKNAKIYRIKKNKKALDEEFRAIDKLIMEFKKDSTVVAKLDSVEYSGSWNIIEGKFLQTTINGLPKLYSIEKIKSDSLLLNETSEKSPIRKFILIRIK
ncbi:MAG: hypothetical protein RMJ53_09580 [Chitinophagales bacterium]|nr:hypothetical protein [Chitinophagales bacterium]MDW8274465.1 hypothetical protein [Chitinophagales bacterium]